MTFTTIVDKVYLLRDNEPDVGKKGKITEAIDVITDSFRDILTSASKFLLYGEKEEVDFSKAKEAMISLREYGLKEIPEDLTDEAVKVFVYTFGKNMLY